MHGKYVYFIICEVVWSTQNSKQRKQSVRLVREANWFPQSPTIVLRIRTLLKAAANHSQRIMLSGGDDENNYQIIYCSMSEEEEAETSFINHMLFEAGCNWKSC